jgi:hypothetical protein
MNWSRTSVAWIACAALVACLDGAAPDATLITRIDQASLSPRGSLDVSFTITNVGSQPEEVPACRGEVSPRLQWEVAPQWEDVGGGLCPAIYSSAPLSLPSGASIKGTTGLCCVRPGTYRLIIAYESDGSPRAISEPFSVQ